MKKTFLINDLVWVTVALMFCIGGFRLGFGSFQRPHAGFMPVVAGMVLAGLAMLDLAIGALSRWRGEKQDGELWGGVNWAKLIGTLCILVAYAVLFTPMGFFPSTFLLLFFLYRMLEPKPWWMLGLASAATTGGFYLIFKAGLDSQLPKGLLGF